MMRQQVKAIKIIGEYESYSHIKMPSNLPSLATLCGGWRAYHYDETDDPTDCPTCLAILAYCKGLTLKEEMGVNQRIQDVR